MKTTPLKPLLLLYATGLLLAIVGPIDYLNIDRTSITLFMAAFALLFILGFQAGLHLDPQTIKRHDDAAVVPWYFYLALTISLCHSSMMFALSLAQNGLSALSFSAGAEQYADSYEQYTRNSGEVRWSWLLSEFFYPFHAAAVCWAVFFYSKLSRLMKCIGLLAMFLIAFRFGIMAGKQKYIGDIIIFAGFVFLAAQHGRKISRLKKSMAASLVLIGIALMVSAISYRYAHAGITYDNINAISGELVRISDNSLFVSVFGPDIGFAIIKLTQYFSNGYYGLSLTLALPFEWTFFIGNSYTLMVLANRIVGGEFLLQRTYPFRAGEEFGWGMDKWHTAFPWYASDLTFPGALLFFGLVAFFYGRIWRDVAIGRNALAVPLYGYLSIGFAFIPANNQLMISPGGVLTLVLFFGLWVASRRQARALQ